MSSERYVFLDFDGTLSNPVLLRKQYLAEIATILSRDFGGESALWEDAASTALDWIATDYQQRFSGNPLAGYNIWHPTAIESSIVQMFTSLSVPIPPSPLQLAQETQFNALLACDAAYSDAQNVLMHLFETDWRVQMASGNSSEYLMAALMGAGLESYTESKFGPDLVDCAKEGIEYYEAIFTACNIDPKDAIVVDDYPTALGWASAIGAKTIHARIDPVHLFESPLNVPVLTQLRDLPRLLNAMVEA